MKLLARIKFEVYDWLQMVFSATPGILGVKMRTIFYLCFLKKMGTNVRMGLRVKIQCPEAIEIGDNFVMNDQVWIAANKDENGAITIGNNVLIGPYTIIHSGNHNYSSPDIPIREQGYTFKKIALEDDVWIGARAIILSGVTLGKGTVVAAGAVVTKSTAPYTVVGGVPAKRIGCRNSSPVSES